MVGDFLQLLCWKHFELKLVSLSKLVTKIAKSEVKNDLVKISLSQEIPNNEHGTSNMNNFLSFDLLDMDP